MNIAYAAVKVERVAKSCKTVDQILKVLSWLDAMKFFDHRTKVHLYYSCYDQLNSIVKRNKNENL